jgi:hypothetical protein
MKIILSIPKITSKAINENKGTSKSSMFYKFMVKPEFKLLMSILLAFILFFLDPNIADYLILFNLSDVASGIFATP